MAILWSLEFPRNGPVLCHRRQTTILIKRVAGAREYSRGTSTSTLALHIKNTQGIADSKLKLSNDMVKTIETEILPDEQRAAIFEEFVPLIVDYKQPFRVVENDKFRAFVNRLNHL